jgi:OmpA-OmpF porin, OOP family
VWSACDLRFGAAIACLWLVACPGPRPSDPTTTPAEVVSTSPPADDDADGDGAHGGLDDCPDAPEDMDGHLDQDGCPDVDDDPQTIADECPPDADDDEIADAVDRCPAEAETYDAHEDDDGCPDGGALRVVREAARIVVEPPIAFDYEHARIRPPSEPSLDALASYLAHHPGIVRLEVQGHLGEEQLGSSRLDRDRARAIVEALVSRGIARERLVPQAYGFTVPLVASDPSHPDRRNWRIEYAIIEELPCLDPEGDAP